MAYLLSSVACSVLVSVLLKLAPRRGWDAAQMVTWNYLAAAALCALLLRPPLQALRGPGAPWPELLVLAAVLPSLFLVLAASVRHAGIVRTDVAQRLSLLLSLGAAFLWFGERASAAKLAGLGLGLLAVGCILARPDPAATAGGRAWGLLLLVWAGFALVDVVLKRVAMAGTPSLAVLQGAFVLAFAGMFAVQLWRHRHGAPLAASSLGAGLLLGVLNFGNILFYVRAHQALPESPAVVFATMNIGVVALGTLVGVLAFGERTSRLNRAGIVLALAAIALVAATR